MDDPIPQSNTNPLSDDNLAFPTDGELEAATAPEAAPVASSIDSSPVTSSPAPVAAPIPQTMPEKINLASLEKIETKIAELKPKPAKKGFLSGFLEGDKGKIEAAKKAEQDRKRKIEEEKKVEEARKRYEAGISSIKDVIAPAALKIAPKYLMLNDVYVRTFFAYTYPRYLYANWLSPIINLDAAVDIAMFIYPQESKVVMDQLRKRATQVQAAISMEEEKGLIRSPELETALSDIEDLRDQLQRGEERLFNFSLYFTIYAKTMEELDNLTAKLESTLGAQLVYTKPALFQTEQGFNTTMPFARDLLDVRRNLNTGALSSMFPFTSMELTSNEGILYGINRHNNSLVIFDRFSMENANMVVFAKAGAGKSFAVKLEALRSLMYGTDVIVIDPENEYKNLSGVVGGTYIPMSLGSDKRLNPFDLPKLIEGAGTTEGEDNLRSTITMLHGLLNLMLGKLTPEEDAVMDKALMETYALHDITADPKTQTNQTPLMEDLFNMLLNMRGAESMAARLQKYVTGTFSGIFNARTNIDLNNGFVVFSIRDLEETLRPIAMYLIMNFIWTAIRFEKRKRLLIVDEAWIMMNYEDAAKFLFSIAKRCRKYWLGLTTITQDVEDFLGSKYGKAIVSNSSIQLLMKQSPASVEVIAQTFNLTEGEKFLLLESGVGEGLFFAGVNHVAIKVYASYAEEQIVTTSPKQISELEAAKKAAE